MNVHSPEAQAASLPISVADVEAAAANIAGNIIRTPCLKSETLSQMTGAQVWLKFENLQFTAAYKERGALNRLLSLTAEERARGVIAASAGNHAQGLAYHARSAGHPGHHRDAALHPDREGAANRKPRCQCGAGWRDI